MYPEQDSQSEYRYRDNPSAPNTQVAPGSSWYHNEKSPYSFRQDGGQRGGRTGESGRYRANSEMDRFRYDPSNGRLIPREGAHDAQSGYVYPGDSRGREGNTPQGYTAPPPSTYRFREMPERKRESQSGALRYRPDQKLDEIPYMPGHGLPNWFDSSGAPPVFRPLKGDKRRKALAPPVEPEYSYQAMEPAYSYPAVPPAADDPWLYRPY